MRRLMNFSSFESTKVFFFKNLKKIEIIIIKRENKLKIMLLEHQKEQLKRIKKHNIDNIWIEEVVSIDHFMDNLFFWKKNSFFLYII